MNNQNIIDWSLCLKRAMNNEAIARELLGKIVEELPTELSQFKKTYQAGDTKKLKEQVHKLHGACCYTGLSQLEETINALEEALIKGSPEIDNLFSQLESAIEDVLNAYREFI